MITEIKSGSSTEPDCSIETDYTWYVDTRGNPTGNALFADILQERVYECESRDQLCEDKVRRDMWLCESLDILERFEEAANEKKIPYSIFVKKGRHGLPQLSRIKNHVPETKPKQRKKRAKLHRKLKGVHA